MKKEDYNQFIYRKSFFGENRAREREINALLKLRDFEDYTPDRIARIEELFDKGVIDYKVRSTGHSVIWKNREGKFDRPFGLPVAIRRDGDFQWVDEKGEYHRENGPAIISKDGGYDWYIHGKLHRVDGPARYSEDSDREEWYLNGERHREGGPAWIKSNGTEAWFINGEVHREDGPAWTTPEGVEKWYIKGKQHREDGPSLISPDEGVMWHLNDDSVALNWKGELQIRKNFDIDENSSLETVDSRTYNNFIKKYFPKAGDEYLAEERKDTPELLETIPEEKEFTIGKNKYKVNLARRARGMKVDIEMKFEYYKSTQNTMTDYTIKYRSKELPLGRIANGDVTLSTDMFDVIAHGFVERRTGKKRDPEGKPYSSTRKFYDSYLSPLMRNMEFKDYIKDFATLQLSKQSSRGVNKMIRTAIEKEIVEDIQKEESQIVGGVTGGGGAEIWNAIKELVLSGNLAVSVKETGLLKSTIYQHLKRKLGEAYNKLKDKIDQIVTMFLRWISSKIRASQQTARQHYHNLIIKKASLS